MENINNLNNINFTHLHVHTGYSLLDGSGKIKNMISKAKELGMKSLAITDHGVMYGCVEFYKEAVEQGIKPIIGCEIYVAGKSMDIKRPDNQNRTYHLVLLVKNEMGYKNLMEIVSAASIEGFYYKPRIDHEFLKNHSEGLIALSACLGGEVQANLLDGDIEKAKEAALFYKSIFHEDFYLELQNHGIPEQLKVNKMLIDMAKSLDIELVCTNDVHYIEKDDFKPHDVLLCIQTGKIVTDENRMKYPSGEFYLKSPKEMLQMFSSVQEAIENTNKIADKCNFNYEFHKSKLPDFPLPKDIDHYKYLRDLCYEGLNKRYKVINDELTKRLEYELDIIKQMGYVDYFLIVWDFIRFANEKHIMTGPGRGSAAGSLVAYTLGITKIDPIKYNLIFERFLNPERVSMPDIDSDFCYERRQEVIDYVVDKYGINNVSQIVTFGTMAPRACIRDVGRALNYSYAEVDKIAKLIPTIPNITIDKALEINSELKKLYDEEERIKNLIDIARSLEGLPRHTSTHAAGVVISSKPLVNYVPLQKNDEAIVTQFTMGNLEELGLLKMDFLGLRTLTVMRDTINFVKENKGIDLNLDSIDFDDQNVYNMIGEGKTVGVFQLESLGMTNFMKELKPNSLEDIIAGISLYRPGPMSEIPRYIENKNYPQGIKYEVPELEHILKVTYGCLVYQEQVMQVVRDLAGYSMGRSDLVRRAMSKKKHKVMEEERHNFIYGIEEDGKVIVPGCIRNGISAESANKIFDLMMDFASYAFNKSHAAAYAVVAFQTAYLICYYPTEYIASMLNSVMGNNEKVAFYIRFANSIGIEVLNPNINEGSAKFNVKGNKILFGLASVKNVGMNVIESMVRCREEKGEFKNIEDFFYRLDFSIVNKRAIESLIKTGAMDCFGVYRSKLLAVYERIIEGISSQRKKNIKGQIDFFTTLKNEDKYDIKIDYPNINEFPKKNILAMEKEMTGLYLSGHPLDEYKEELRRQTSNKTSDLILTSSLEDDNIESTHFVKDGAYVILGGIISNVNTKITKTNKMMAFIKLEDLEGSIEVIIFSNNFEKYKRYIQEDKLVIIKGRINIREEEQPKIICENISPLIKNNTEKLYIQISDKKQLKNTISRLRNLFENYAGEMPVYLCTKEDRKKYEISSQYWIRRDDNLISMLNNQFGEENIKII